MINLTGKKFGRLTVVDIAQHHHSGIKWNCICDCGKKCIVFSYNLISGQTKSCGCYQKEKISQLRRMKPNRQVVRIKGGWQCGNYRFFN